jgi:hypothetical protein
MRTCVTILTPSLALLIGFQDSGLSESVLLRYLLVTVISLMTIAILLGVFALRSESRGHVLSRNEAIRQHNEGVPLNEIEEARIDLPKRYLLALEYFPTVFWLSILFLGGFGIAKYVI